MTPVIKVLNLIVMLIGCFACSMFILSLHLPWYLSGFLQSLIAIGLVCSVQYILTLRITFNRIDAAALIVAVMFVFFLFSHF